MQDPYEGNREESGEGWERYRINRNRVASLISIDIAGPPGIDRTSRSAPSTASPGCHRVDPVTFDLMVTLDVGLWIRKSKNLNGSPEGLEPGTERI